MPQQYKITKDEARILAASLEDYKYELVNHFARSKNEGLKMIAALNSLQERLSKFGIDKRRKGRKSMNDFEDLLKRFTN